MDGTGFTPADLRWVGTISRNNIVHDVWALPSGRYIYVPMDREPILKSRARAFKIAKELDNG